MLKNRYQEILLGMGIMSLVRGIISLRRNKTTLLIDDKRFTVDSYPGLFLSDLEVLSLIRLGNKYEIPELVSLRQFLMPSEIEFVSGERRIKLGQSPLENIKEMLRKFPELLDQSDLDLVYQENEVDFEKYFLSELQRYEEQTYKHSSLLKGQRFDFQGPQWLKTIYNRFADYLNQEYQDSMDLKYASFLHLLGVSSEEKLKTAMGAEEVPYFFFRGLSRIYRLQDFFLATQLKRRLILLGGDFKESSVQFWQLHNNKFENLLLASFEGVISGERVLFFSHLPEEAPFKIVSPYTLFRKTQMSPLKRDSAPFPPSSLTYFTDSNLLGSERPYRVLARGRDFSSYHWPYPELPGSKPEFYADELQNSFSLDSTFYPFTSSAVETTHCGSSTIDLRGVKPERKKESSVLTRLPLEIMADDSNIKGFEYWGPFRYKALGLLALCYGIEEK